MSHTAYLLSWLAIPSLILIHLYVSPFTKVEESFNIQAIHDVLEHGVPLKNVVDTLKIRYDHMTFPGAVPRTFVGAIGLAGLSQPVLTLGYDVDRQLLG